MDDGAYTYTPKSTMTGTVSESIGFSLTDMDGDTSTGTLGLNFSREGNTLTGSSSNDTLTGTSASEVIIGGAGNDIMTGGLGADTFKWNFADRGTVGSPAQDTIKDFDSAIDGDRLDLRDLLQGESSGTLTDYLHFVKSGTNTVIEVRDTAGGSVTERITLENVDLTVNSTLTDQAIINDLLNKGKLHTD